MVFPVRPFTINQSGRWDIIYAICLFDILTLWGVIFTFFNFAELMTIGGRFGQREKLFSGRPLYLASLFPDLICRFSDTLT